MGAYGCVWVRACAIRRVAVASGIFFGSISLCVNFGLLGVLGYGGSMVNSGAMSAGDLTSFALYALTAAAGYRWAMAGIMARVGGLGGWVGY
jgi:ABC-type multidrug transport system fused ATPase/permease subunit